MNDTVVVTAPDNYILYILYTINKKSIFLAGGITNCPDWQQEAIELFTTFKTPLVIFNPRQKNFDVNDPTASKKQIIWEYNCLKAVDAILFWFSEGSLNPIVLFEYGKELGRKRNNIFVGCHPNYPRLTDVIIQTYLERPNLMIDTTLNSLVCRLVDWVKTGEKNDTACPSSQ
jgi:hypothetical protein